MPFLQDKKFQSSKYSGRPHGAITWPSGCPQAAGRVSRCLGMLLELCKPTLMWRKGGNKLMQSHFPRKPFPIYGQQLLVLMQTAFSILFKTYHYNQPLKSISSSLLCPHKSSMYFSPPRPRSITIMFTHGVSRQPFVEVLILCLKEHVKMAQSIYLL